MKNKNVDMINGSLWKNIFLFALPMMATNLLEMLFNAADTIVVGKFAGQSALAAVGATGSLIFMFASLFQGLASGTNVIVARDIGAGNKERVSRACHTSVVMGFLAGSLLMVTGLLFSRNFLSLMETPSDIISLSATYMRIYFVGSLFMIEYNFCASILRAKGDTRRPLYFLMISGALNVFLNLVFVIGLHLSVVGVAMATVISQAVSAFLVLRALFTEKSEIGIRFKDLRLDLDVALEILKIGVPAGVQGMAFALTNVVVQSSINSFNSSVIVAGNTAASNLENFIYIGMMAFSNATVTFTSQNLGAGKKERLLKVMWITMFLDCACAIVVGGFINLNAHFFLSFYTNDLVVIEAGKIRLFWVGMFLALNGALDILSCSMRGLGSSFTPMVILIVGVVFVRLIWLMTYFPLHRELSVIYQCFPVSWLITTIIFIIFYIPLIKKVLRSM